MSDTEEDHPISAEHSLPGVGGPKPGLASRLHFVWFVFWGIVLTIPLAALQVVTHVFRPTARNFKVWSGLWGRSILTFAGVRVSVEEDVALYPDKPCIFIANHQNLLDILAFAGYLPYPFGFVAKQELARVPMLGLAIRNSASVFLDRSDPRKAIESLKKAGERIRSGMSVLLYPEGTRAYRPVLLPFKKGAFLLAIEAGVPVVPVVMVDGYRLMNEKEKASRPGHVTIRMLTPIDIEGATRKDIPEIMERLREVMDEPLQHHRRQLLSSAHPPLD
ncbi:MAG: lysophospholipid acyltransferase family protein [Bacteroidota bacterium]